MNDIKDYCFNPILGCSILSITYVCSLYIWNANGHRNDPSIIKRRFVSVLVMTAISPFFIIVFSHCGFLAKYTLLELMGIRKSGLLMASILPLLLTMLLFLGPLIIQRHNSNWAFNLELSDWLDNLKNLLWLRDHIIAPLSEEFSFRACMLPLLLQCFQTNNAVFICPLFFGIAHLHHMYGHIRSGVDIKVATTTTVFQVFYTSLFGAYSAYLFLRTGHLISPFLAHAFCNYMGFPDFSEVIKFNEPKRTIILIISTFGLISWCILLKPLTNPKWYANYIYWNT